MELRYFLLADFANFGDDKLNIIGAFRTIRAKQFPMQHPSMYLVADVAIEVEEHDSEYTAKVLFLDGNAEEFAKMEGRFSVPRYNLKQPSKGSLSLIFAIRDMKFEKPSRYELRLLVDDHLLGILPLDVVQLEDPLQAD